MFKKLAYILAKKILTKLKYFNYGFPLFISTNDYLKSFDSFFHDQEYNYSE